MSFAWFLTDTAQQPVFPLYEFALSNFNIDRATTGVSMDTISVLLVEDEPLLALDVESALIDAGYTVTMTSSGEQALEALSSMGALFSAMVTDIRLGYGADGWAVAKKARELIPGLPVVYMSGDSAADWTSMGIPESVMLTKPMALSQVVVALAQLMNARHS